MKSVAPSVPARLAPVAPQGDRSISVRTHDPGEFSERAQTFAAGIRMSAMTARGFRSRVRAWPLARSAIVSIYVADGQAWFPSNRSYGSFTLPIVGGFEAGSGVRKECFGPGSAYFISPARGGGEIRPAPGSHLLGLNLDCAQLEAHEEALDARWGERLPTGGDSMLRLGGAAGRRFVGYANWIERELTARNSLLQLPYVAQEVEATLAQLLVEARFPEPQPASTAPSGASVIRAEEFLAACLERPASLAEVGRAAAVSTRTLSRTFLAKHGMGPMAFLRRRRFEAARRDLFAATPGEVSVTDVALRYGFGHLGRFAKDYRHCFGESPSATLGP